MIRLYSVGKEKAEVLAAIHEACFPDYWDTSAFNDFFAVTGTYAIIAMRDKPCGMVVYRKQFEQADIITIAVLPEYRKQGIARALMEASLLDLTASGAEILFLDVEDGNQPALSLYEGLGFAVQRRRRLYYRHKDGTCTDALVMEKKLS